MQFEPTPIVERFAFTTGQVFLTGSLAVFEERGGAERLTFPKWRPQ